MAHPSHGTHAPKPGDRVRLVTDKESIEGTLLPTPHYQQGMVVLKLDTGYNIGIEQAKVRSLDLLARHALEEKAPPAKPQQKGLPAIAILHTGGTIASKVDYKTGGVVARYSPEELLSQFPELGAFATVHSRLLRNMWSEDMRFSHYNIMAREVCEEEKRGVAGVIITHGTDTLHYSAAALAFALEGVSIPVLLVGAQRSSDRGSSDAAVNLLNAAYFISEAKGGFHGVAICMHENMSDDSSLILPACKSRKMHTSRRDAFRPINAGALCRVDYRRRIVSRLDGESPQWGKAPAKASLRPFKEDLRVGLLKLHTNMYASEVLAYKGFQGLVVEATGLGQAPVNEIDEFTAEHTRIRAAIKDLIAAGTVVVFAPQTIYGRLQMDVYQPARELQDMGVRGHLSDMTPETTFIKLAWLLSSYPKEKAAALIAENLRGELSERTAPDEFLS